jgi:hypothetical protein
MLYFLGFVGLHPALAAPFLGEVLYPGVCSLMPVVVPLLCWPSHKLRGLVVAVAVFGVAFLAGVAEGALCSGLGAHWTTPAVCFAMCDVLFIVLADLLDVTLL